MRIVATVRALYCWTLREDWRTWVSHFLGAAVLMALGLPGFAVFFAYAFAEGKELLDKLAHGIQPNYLDHGMDALSPFLALVLGSILGWW